MSIKSKKYMASISELRSQENYCANLKPKQFSAIKCSVKLGQKLQKLYPQIADDYRTGYSLKQIVDKYDLTESYDISKSVAATAVKCALNGYDSHFEFFDYPSYDGLIPVDEYKDLAVQQHSLSGKRLAEHTRINKNGIYGLTLDERIKCGQKGAKILMQKKLGIHAQTYEDHKKFGKLSAQSRGLILWTDEEKYSTLEMATQPDKTYRQGSKILVKKIAEELNEIYHAGNQIRTSVAVASFLRCYNQGRRQ